jgi:hypothetical protein
MYGPTLSGTLLRWGSGRPNSSRSSANPRRLLPDQLHRAALFSSAYSDGTYGDSSRGSPPWPLWAPLGPSSPERSFWSRGGRVMRLEAQQGRTRTRSSRGIFAVAISKDLNGFFLESRWGSLRQTNIKYLQYFCCRTTLNLIRNLGI